jgi:putative acetyltransferase
MLSVRSNPIIPRERLYPIRQRENGDSRALYELFSQPRCKQGMISDAFTSAAHFQAWIDSISTNKLDVVATYERAVVGYAGLFLCHGNRGHVGWLCLFVHDEFQGHGIGGLLMRAIVAAGDATPDLLRIELTVICDNQRAIDLYQRLGFKIEGRHDRFAQRAGLIVDVYTMSRITKSARHLLPVTNEG